jgi:glycine/sarcosine N-methyltransferase
MRNVPAITCHAPRRVRLRSDQPEETGEIVLVTLFILKESQDGWSCSLWTTRARAWHRTDMQMALSAAGFDRVDWHSIDETGYYQPIVTAM